MSDGLILEYICSLVTLETIGRKLLLILLCFDWVLNLSLTAVVMLLYIVTGATSVVRLSVK